MTRPGTYLERRGAVDVAVNEGKQLFNADVRRAQKVGAQGIGRLLEIHACGEFGGVSWSFEFQWSFSGKWSVG